MNPPQKTEASKGGLPEIIFGKGDVPVFAMLDGASAKGLVKKLYELEPEYCCLYRGELPPDMALVAPYLVRMEAGSEFAEYILNEGWGMHWGVFVTGNATMRNFRDHFRQFHKVELPDQSSVIFRHYDPRVLRCFLPVCNAAELAAFFGPVQSFILEGESPENAVKFSLTGKTLKSESLKLKKPTKP
jgi:hypothetical protein